jgi:hypothetical protein
VGHARVHAPEQHAQLRVEVAAGHGVNPLVGEPERRARIRHVHHARVGAGRRQLLGLALLAGTRATVLPVGHQHPHLKRAHDRGRAARVVHVRVRQVERVEAPFQIGPPGKECVQVRQQLRAAVIRCRRNVVRAWAARATVVGRLALAARVDEHGPARELQQRGRALPHVDEVQLHERQRLGGGLLG